VLIKRGKEKGHREYFVQLIYANYKSKKEKDTGKTGEVQIE
jgi:hypothetical protein